MKTAVMTEEKLPREDEIDKVKDTVKRSICRKFAGHEEEAQFLKEVKQIAEDLKRCGSRIDHHRRYSSGWPSIRRNPSIGIRSWLIATCSWFWSIYWDKLKHCLLVR